MLSTQILDYLGVNLSEQISNGASQSEIAIAIAIVIAIAIRDPRSAIAIAIAIAIGSTWGQLTDFRC